MNEYLDEEEEYEIFVQQYPGSVVVYFAGIQEFRETEIWRRFRQLLVWSVFFARLELGLGPS